MRENNRPCPRNHVSQRVQPSTAFLPDLPWISTMPSSSPIGPMRLSVPHSGHRTSRRINSKRMRPSYYPGPVRRYPQPWRCVYCARGAPARAVSPIARRFPNARRAVPVRPVARASHRESRLAMRAILADTREAWGRAYAREPVTEGDRAVVALGGDRGKLRARAHGGVGDPAFRAGSRWPVMPCRQFRYLRVEDFGGDGPAHA